MNYGFMICYAPFFLKGFYHVCIALLFRKPVVTLFNKQIVVVYQLVGIKYDFFFFHFPLIFDATKVLGTKKRCIPNVGDAPITNFCDASLTNIGEEMQKTINFAALQNIHPMTTPIKIIVVDDHRLFRMAIKAALGTDICVVGEADSGQVLFALPALSTADLVLLDINLPGMSGEEIAKRLRRDYPHLKILAISAENNAQMVKLMVEAGIDGFISKQCGDTDELAQAIRTVVSGLEYFGRDIAAIIYEIFVTKKIGAFAIPEFTEREKEVIHLCREGLLCKEIADRMGISANTVNTHKKNIFLKLGINNTMEMVQYAVKNGIIKVES